MFGLDGRHVLRRPRGLRRRDGTQRLVPLTLTRREFVYFDTAGSQLQHTAPHRELHHRVDGARHVQ